jgi:hypothetical protein
VSLGSSISLSSRTDDTCRTVFAITNSVTFTTDEQAMSYIAKNYVPLGTKEEIANLALLYPSGASSLVSTTSQNTHTRPQTPNKAPPSILDSSTSSVPSSRGSRRSRETSRSKPPAVTSLDTHRRRRTHGRTFTSATSSFPSLDHTTGQSPTRVPRSIANEDATDPISRRSSPLVPKEE